MKTDIAQLNPASNGLSITERELRNMATYIAEYLAEENVAEVDSWLICNAIDAYLGGAAD